MSTSFLGDYSNSALDKHAFLMQDRLASLKTNDMIQNTILCDQMFLWSTVAQEDLPRVLSEIAKAMLVALPPNFEIRHQIDLAEFGSNCCDKVHVPTDTWNAC